MQKYNDTIYHVSPQGAEPYTIVDYGEYGVTEDKLIKSAFPLLWIPKVDCMEDTRFYAETSDHIYFVFDYDTMNPDSPYYVLYDKKNKKSTIYTNSIFDDISFYPYAPQIVDANSKEEYIAVMEPFILSHSYNSAKTEYKKWDEDTRKRYDEMKDLINLLNEDSNPVLMLLSFTKQH